MPDSDPNLDDLDSDPRGLRDFAERQQREATEARQELANLRKKDGFRDAGLDPTNPLHAAVIDGYRGEQGGIKDFVTGLGLTNSNQAPPEPAIPDLEREALERVGSMPSGDGGQPLDPDADGNARLKDITDRATRERWGQQRFNDEFTAEMTRQRRPVAQTPGQEMRYVRGGELT